MEQPHVDKLRGERGAPERSAAQIAQDILDSPVMQDNDVGGFSKELSDPLSLIWGASSFEEIMSDSQKYYDDPDFCLKTAQLKLNLEEITRENEDLDENIVRNALVIISTMQQGATRAHGESKKKDSQRARHPDVTALLQSHPDYGTERFQANLDESARVAASGNHYSVVSYNKRLEAIKEKFHTLVIALNREMPSLPDLNLIEPDGRRP